MSSSSATQDPFTTVVNRPPTPLPGSTQPLPSDFRTGRAGVSSAPITPGLSRSTPEPVPPMSSSPGSPPLELPDSRSVGDSSPAAVMAERGATWVPNSPIPPPPLDPTSEHMLKRLENPRRPPTLTDMPPKVLVGIMASLETPTILKNFAVAREEHLRLFRENLRSIMFGIALNMIDYLNIDIAMVAIHLFEFPWGGVRSFVNELTDLCHDGGFGPLEIMEMHCSLIQLPHLLDRAEDVNRLAAHYLAHPPPGQDPDEYWAELLQSYHAAWPPERRTGGPRPIISEQEQATCRRMAFQFLSRSSAYSRLTDAQKRSNKFVTTQRQFWQYELACRNAAFCRVIKHRQFSTGGWIAGEQPAQGVRSYLNFMTEITVHVAGANDTSARGDDAAMFDMMMKHLRWWRGQNLGVQ